ncbi:hydroxylysine kinase /5-phosphonooxy-L-lysine phospho-lyase apoenzyme [Muriicola jejuensis]|uniref:Aminotransferase class III-fold pyridoxal phosphate-dependent enzyme n=1 Tax=Muriicola jejuensis TaxID=504488 RepID=A0A6P0UG05_9FLAO|nr:aminotransferase class III-fold pyridoxal phosphate-dependent enzyme [Muriicola jejuensis]NER11370.1 aminotransferase class III-fold pyridoxal phosphate-dependent enzyme [Muriicola jejuensis]SMP21078.1 hydroxylysine kinase /5-phosphonooxy-L-lysine phospho-lyase apoenzyme [Muriicola jejuensis]
MQLDEILKRHYTLENCSLTDLQGYGSSNTKVETPGGIYVCKQYTNTERIRNELLAEDRVLQQLGTMTTCEFPMRIPTNAGEPFVVEGDLLYRLLTFLEGDFLGSVTHTPELLYSLGRTLGRMDKILALLTEVVYEGKNIPWDLKNTDRSRPLLSSVPNASDRSLAAYFFLQFEDRIRPFAHEFRQSLIYSDANDWNILTAGNKVTGIIDFGDMCHTWMVNEVAIGMTYVMMHKDQPLDSGLNVLQGYQAEMPLTELECDSLYYLIAARLCISVCNSAEATRKQQGSSYITVSEEGAWKLLRQLLTINPLHAADEFRRVCGHSRVSKTPVTRLLDNRKAHFGKNLSLSYRDPIPMDRAAFQYMYDSRGNTFLDAYNNIMIVGHCHPRVVQAGRKAMAKLNTNTRYLYESLETYSTTLFKKFPPHLNKVYFVNSGSEASDLAIRMAKYHTGKDKVAVLEDGYHGHTQGGIQISAYKYHSKGSSGRPDSTVELALPKVFGSPWKDDGSAGVHYAREAIEHITKSKGEIAAFIAEPIVGCGGQVPLAKGYLEALYPEIRSQGGVCISDEVQVGFGRLGDVFWGHELYGVVPDIVVLGKPMGNGHPMGAVVTTTEIAESFGRGPEFFSSFGGNPVSCAIGLAVLEVLEEEGLQEQARLTGTYLLTSLNDLAKKHEVIGDVRGHGLFLGIELISPQGQPKTQLAAVLKNALRDQFVLVSTDGPFDNVIKIKPPLRFNKENADELVLKIDAILSQNMVIK